MFKKGFQFTGKWFTGLVEVQSVEGNDLHVKLWHTRTPNEDDSWRFETWNLQHTEWGWKNDDYFLLKDAV